MPHLEEDHGPDEQRDGSVEVRIGSDPPLRDTLGQLDQDSLPDYALLDDILDDYVEYERSFADLVKQGVDSEVVSRVIPLTDTAEYKRRQYPPGTNTSLRVPPS